MPEDTATHDRGEVLWSKKLKPAFPVEGTALLFQDDDRLRELHRETDEIIGRNKWE
jgi:hypothetical protein